MDNTDTEHNSKRLVVLNEQDMLESLNSNQVVTASKSPNSLVYLQNFVDNAKSCFAAAAWNVISGDSVKETNPEADNKWDGVCSNLLTEGILFWNI